MRLFFIALCATFLISCSPKQTDIINQNMGSLVEIYSISPKDEDKTDSISPVAPPQANPDTLRDDKDKPKEKEKNSGLGSGFIIAPNVIVTNYHVIHSPKNNIKVLGYNSVKIYDAYLIAGDERADIAVIRLEDWDDFAKNINPRIVKWGSSRNLRVGEEVWSLGNPYGLDWTVATGVISNKLRYQERNGAYYMQTTTAIYPGNSGGPLFNSRGEVIGINSAMFGREGFFGLTIPSDYASKVVDDLLKHLKIVDGRLGIIMDRSDDKHFIKVKAISEKSPAIAAGLLPNDLIVGIKTEKTQGRFVPVKLDEQLITEIMLLSPGDPVSLQIIRDGVSRIIELTVAPVAAL